MNDDLDRRKLSEEAGGRGPTWSWGGGGEEGLILMIGFIFLKKLMWIQF